MINGLLDSQIRSMSGKEIAERVVGLLAGLVEDELSSRPRTFKPVIEELGRIIDDIRAADRACPPAFLKQRH